ncbi:MAG: hypothetical protein E6R04_01785 [Spirochaetes bacterium]|nr:MAG: hypothetical protein E6R04_01785 [Spirochaetota bacterium]
MKTSLKTLLLTLALSAVAACAPCAPSEDASIPVDGAVADSTPADAVCLPATTAVVEDGSELVVLQDRDSQGAPFQVGLVRVATSVEVTNSQGAQPHGLALFLNGVRQSTLIWNGRAVGMSRIAATVPQGNFCPGAMHGYLVQLGFGTVGNTMPQEGLSVVGHQLQDGQPIAVRFDVCTADSCVQGAEKQMIVRVR